MNADPIAPWYRVFEYLAFGHSLQRRRLEFLSDVAPNRKALVLGDGDGRFLAALAKLNPAMKIDYVDQSREMLNLAARRARSFEHIRFHNADARTFVPDDRDYDLIATHFFLDCFEQEECDQVISRVSEMARPAAHWLISEFRVPESGLQRLWAQFWIRLSYWFFRLTTGLKTSNLPLYSRQLERCGFQLAQRRVSPTGLLVSDLWTRR